MTINQFRYIKFIIGCGAWGNKTKRNVLLIAALQDDFFGVSEPSINFNIFKMIYSTSNNLQVN